MDQADARQLHQVGDVLRRRSSRMCCGDIHISGIKFATDSRASLSTSSLSLVMAHKAE